jgi:hypothetical protein
MIPYIIGISGKKQSGKSTIANRMHEIFSDIESEIIRFADPLKDIVRDCFIPVEWNWTIESFESEENKRKVTPCGKTVRELLQIVGTDWFRSVYPDAWVNTFRMSMKFSTLPYVFVPDCRFPNELKVIQDMGGIVVRTLRHPFEDNHASETALDEVQKNTMDIEGGGFPIWKSCGTGDYLATDVPEYMRGKKFDLVLDNTEMTMDDLYLWCDWLAQSILEKNNV